MDNYVECISFTCDEIIFGLLLALVADEHVNCRSAGVKKTQAHDRVGICSGPRRSRWGDGDAGGAMTEATVTTRARTTCQYCCQPFAATAATAAVLTAMIATIN